jgi:hypothetical protein
MRVFKLKNQMVFALYLLTLYSLSAQIEPVEQDSTRLVYLVEGDSVAREAIELREVVLLRRLSFDNTEERRRYLILRRRTHKVYPYAKLAAERLVSLESRLATLDKKRDQRRYAKRVQKFLEEEFSAELKKLTKSEGKILLKLIYRQTGETAFDLVKQLRNGWRAFWYNNTASLFDLSLKVTYSPELVYEDFLIEDILLRAFQSELLERQEPAFEIDYYTLSDKWSKPKKQP